MSGEGDEWPGQREGRGECARVHWCCCIVITPPSLPCRLRRARHRSRHRRSRMRTKQTSFVGVHVTCCAAVGERGGQRRAHGPRPRGRRAAGAVAVHVRRHGWRRARPCGACGATRMHRGEDALILSPPAPSAGHCASDLRISKWGIRRVTMRCKGGRSYYPWDVTNVPLKPGTCPLNQAFKSHSIA